MASYLRVRSHTSERGTARTGLTALFGASHASFSHSQNTRISNEGPFETIASPSLALSISDAVKLLQKSLHYNKTHLNPLLLLAYLNILPNNLPNISMEPLRHLNTHSQSLNNGSGPSYEQVQNSKKKALARPNHLRVIIRLITLAVGASIVGVLAHAAAVWYTTRYDILMQPHGVLMRGWPAQMSLIPTWVMLAAAAIAIIVQIVALLTLVGG